MDEAQPRWIAFVGKQADTMTTGTNRPDHGARPEPFAGARAFVMPSTSPANAAVARDEKRRWFRRLHAVAYDGADA